MDTEFLKGKTVLVTGGTGSFGQKFVERLFNLGICKKIIILSRDEFKQHQMQQKFVSPKLMRFFLGDIRDLSRLQRAFLGVDIVVHAAALKQVPALEYNPLEAVKTNVLGTQNVIDAALDAGVKKVLLISTDKAVNPVNLYGATKLCAEKLLIAANAYRPVKETSTAFSVVRYGNVLGSRGSIVEVLNEQKKNCVVTLTDEKMTRFFMTVDQSVDLVLYALRMMRGEDVFIPKLPAMKLPDLISAIAPGCEVKVVGIRPGEKLHEILLNDDEVKRTRDAGKYYIVEPSKDWWNGAHLKDYPYLPEDFVYASNNVKVIGKEEFLKLV